jgi:hypothetical protein
MKLKYLYFTTLIIISFIFACAGYDSQVKIHKSHIQYFKSHTYDYFIRGETADYALWLDETNWRVLKPDDPEFEALKDVLFGNYKFDYKFLLMHKSNKVFALIEDVLIPATIEKLDRVSSKLINRVGGRIISKEIRFVNGNEVLYVKHAWANWIYCSYYYSNKTGTVIIVAFTAEFLFSEYASDIFDLLNGLDDSNSTIQPTKSGEDIETKLLKLKNLRDKGLITQEDYDKKKNEMLKSY